MTNQLLPLLELGASNRVNNNPTIDTRDQGFSRTFQDAEKEVTSNKPDAQTAKEADYERQESTTKHSRPVEDKESVPSKVSSENDKSVDNKGESTVVAEEASNTPVDNQEQETTHSVTAQVTDSSVTNLEAIGIGLDVTDTTDLASLLEQLSARLQNLQSAEGTELDPQELQGLVDELFIDSSQLPIGDIASTVTEALTNQPLTVANAAQFINDLKKYGQLSASTESTGVRFNDLLSSNSSVASLNTNNLLSQSSIVNSSLINEGLDTVALQAGTGITSTALTDKLVNFSQLLNTSDPASKLSTEISSITGLSTTPITAATATAKPQLAIGTPFQQEQWGEAVTERVMWLSSQGLQEAEIHLNPAELGPMQVKVSVANEQAHISFIVNNTSVREALDQNAIRLREMFDGEGINLVDVDVSDQSQQQAGNSEKDTNHQDFAKTANEHDTMKGETALSSYVNGTGLLSIYA